MITDLFSLKLAIYFIVPPLMICVVAYGGGHFLAAIAEVLFQHEVRHDKAVLASAVPAIASLTVGVASYTWFSGFLIAAIFGTAAYFVVGTIAYTCLLADYTFPNDPDQLSETEVRQGSQISGIMSILLFAVLLLVGYATSQLSP
ncbi:hypothetical protein K227x_59790 [Rubripirellula lacrimiformis]|uniref:DUF350 domain-containing protein n=1 Tax=Rubripirellula lacrimiformis TaxID=1930273 RepID=A0A517NK82_9BACT|nr:hypothetical protein [Rubripirellula lacrimiformis]QDT07551.1 hypothetical protein K227x_59790 [Rubripirellula lacrimiformis]